MTTWRCADTTGLHADDRITSGSIVPIALTDGFQAAFIGATAIAIVGILVALLAVRRSDLEQAYEVDAVPLPEAA